MSVGVLTPAGDALLVVLYVAIGYVSERLATLGVRTLVFLGIFFVKVVNLLRHAVLVFTPAKEIYRQEQRTKHYNNTHCHIDARNQTYAHTEQRQYTLQTLLVGFLRNFILYVEHLPLIFTPYSFQRA